MLIQNWFLTKKQLEWLLAYHDWIRCYSCHMLSGDLPYDQEDTEVIGLAFVRNPVNRFVSSYNFQRGDNYRGGIAKEHGFDAFFNKALVKDDNPMWRNGQTFQLGGSGSDVGLGVVADRVKSGKMILLPTERFDECSVLLERMFPNDFKDCSYTRVNVSKQRATVSEKQWDGVSEYMDVDFKLLSLANQYVDSMLGRLFPDLTERQAYLDDFQRRCKLKKQRRRLSYAAKNLGNTFQRLVKKLTDRK